MNMEYKVEDTVLAWINIQNASSVNPQGGSLQLGQEFYWANPVSSVVTPYVTLSGCSGFCENDSYTVPAPPPGQSYGLKKAKLLSAPTSWTFSESPNQWNAPGAPRIINPPMPTPLDANVNKEVA
jgi:hypothetical protein